MYKTKRIRTKNERTIMAINSGECAFSENAESIGSRFISESIQSAYFFV
jgi:hypothetical protein